MKTVTFNTSGTHCSSCAMLIEMTLSDLPGVAEATADHGRGTASATYDPAVTDADALAEEIRKLGYGAEIACS